MVHTREPAVAATAPSAVGTSQSSTPSTGLHQLRSAKCNTESTDSLEITDLSYARVGDRTVQHEQVPESANPLPSLDIGASDLEANLPCTL